MANFEYMSEVSKLLKYKPRNINGRWQVYKKAMMLEIFQACAMDRGEIEPDLSDILNPASYAALRDFCSEFLEVNASLQYNLPIEWRGGRGVGVLVHSLLAYRKWPKQCDPIDRKLIDRLKCACAGLTLPSLDYK